MENVTVELLKNGQLLKKIVTTKNGKYSFDMNQDTVNKKNEYVIHVIKEGTVPKTLIVNTYIPKEEYDDNTFEYVLEITLVPTTVNDVVIQRPSAKIKWNQNENNFGLDQVYAKIIQKEEEKLNADPDKYLQALAEKMKKEEEDKRNEEQRRKKEDTDKKIREELARKTAEQEAVLAEKKKQDVKENLKNNLNTIKNELNTIAKVNDTIKKKVPVIAEQPVTNHTETFNDPKNYELKKATIDLMERKVKTEKKKNDNLIVKYETSNVMSSLLDAVDEHDKSKKNK